MGFIGGRFMVHHGDGVRRGGKAPGMARLGRQRLRLLHSVQRGGEKEAESGGWKQPSLPLLAGE